MVRETDHRYGIQWIECDECGEQSDPLPLWEGDLDPSRHSCCFCAEDGAMFRY